VPEAENVKELLEEVKNMSELMLNLAYSSVFFESKEIAKEVVILYNDMEDVEERLYLHLFAASRGRQAKRLISIIDIVESSKFVANAARKMAELVLAGEALHPVIKEALMNTDEGIAKADISPASVFVGKSLGQLKLRTRTGANVIAVKRGSKWIISPRKENLLEAGDVIIAAGSRESCKYIRKIAKADIKKF